MIFDDETMVPPLVNYKLLLFISSENTDITVEHDDDEARKSHFSSLMTPSCFHLNTAKFISLSPLFWRSITCVSVSYVMSAMARRASAATRP